MLKILQVCDCKLYDVISRDVVFRRQFSFFEEMKKEGLITYGTNNIDEETAR